MSNSSENLLKVGMRFESHQEAVSTVQNFGKQTNQLFVMAPGAPRTKVTNPLHKKFPYSSLRFLCKHGGTYRPHRSETPKIRKNQTSVKIGCPVEIKLKVIENQLQILSISDAQLHNHPVSDSLFKFYPENRRLTKEEKAVTANLIQSRVAPRYIAKTINSSRQEKQSKGETITKDIFNIGTKLRQEKRKGKTEEEVLTELLNSLLENDPSGTYEVRGNYLKHHIFLHTTTIVIKKL